MKKKLITPEYNRRAIKKYQAKFDSINLRVPKGMKDKLKTHINGELSMNQYILNLINSDLEKSSK